MNGLERVGDSRLTSCRCSMLRKRERGNRRRGSLTGNESMVHDTWGKLELNEHDMVGRRQILDLSIQFTEFKFPHKLFIS